MGTRNKPPVRAIAQGQLGVLGSATFSLAGTVVSGLIKTGCIAGVVGNGSVGQFVVSLWPSQPFYTVVAICNQVGTNVPFVSVLDQSFANMPRGFTGVCVGVGPVTAVNATVIHVTICGPAGAGS